MGSLGGTESAEYTPVAFPQLQKDEEAHEHAVLSDAIPPSNGGLPVIAVDLDDVLSQTNQKIADCKLEERILWQSPTDN
jgi:hypothetical protein